VMGKIQR